MGSGVLLGGVWQSSVRLGFSDGLAESLSLQKAIQLKTKLVKVYILAELVLLKRKILNFSACSTSVLQTTT